MKNQKKKKNPETNRTKNMQCFERSLLLLLPQIKVSTTAGKVLDQSQLLNEFGSSHLTFLGHDYLTKDKSEVILWFQSIVHR